MQKDTRVQASEEEHVKVTSAAPETQESGQGGGKGIFGAIKEKLGFKEGAGGEEGPQQPSADEEVRRRVEAAGPTTPGRVTATTVSIIFVSHTALLKKK